MDKKLESFAKLLTIMDELRAQCPWDREQTMESLRHLTIEETYELSEAIMEGQPEQIQKELGDVLLHIVFYAKIGSENGSFDIQQVIDGLCEKLIFRHPHIYGSTEVNSSDEVKENWEKLKLKEKKKAGEKQSVLSGVPTTLPALIKAARIQEKVKAVGFDWENASAVLGKVEEEIAELKAEIREIEKEKTAISENRKNQMEAEFGDVLFSLINYARFMGINPEDALERTNKKFIKRFRFIEEKAQAQGQNITALSLDQMNSYWEESKKH